LACFDVGFALAVGSCARLLTRAGLHFRRAIARPRASEPGAVSACTPCTPARAGATSALLRWWACGGVRGCAPCARKPTEARRGVRYTARRGRGGAAVVHACRMRAKAHREVTAAHVHDVQLAAACHRRLGHVTFREVVLGAIASMCRRTLEKHGAFFIVFDLFLCGAILYHTPVNRARSVVLTLH